MLSQILARIPQNIQTPADAAVLDLAKYARGGLIQGSFTAAVRNGIARVRLPVLPDNSTWVCGAVGSMKAKIASVGSASATTITLVGPAGNVAAWTLTGGVDTDDTYKNASAVDQTGLAGEQYLTLNVTALATGATGLITLQLNFTATMRMDDLLLVP